MKVGQLLIIWMGLSVMSDMREDFSEYFSERDMFLMCEAMNAGHYYKSLDGWLSDVIADGGYIVAQHLSHDANKKQAATTQAPKMSRIALRKVELMGGEVCGVLVRNGAGALAAVSEHGRVTWLDDYIMAPVARDEGVPAQGDAEPVWGWKPSKPGRYVVRGFDSAGTEALVSVIEDDGELVCNLHDSNSDPAERYSNLLSEISDKFEWAELFTRPPSAGVPEWVECSERLPRIFEPVAVAYHSDADGEPCLDSGVAALQPDGTWLGLGVFYAPYKEGGYRTDLAKKEVTHWQPIPQPPKQDGE